MMAIKTLVYFSILWSLLINYGTGAIKLSRKQEVEFEKQFKLLQKPSVKTIKTEHGDIYDCVDFYKQPAFDHPLLRNHSFHPQMRPNYTLKQRKATTFSQEDEIVIESLKLKDGGCPTGTVPIRRVTKQDFIQIKRFTRDYASRTKPDYLSVDPGFYYAILQTTTEATAVYNGVGAEISIHNPLLKSSDQYSSAEFILQNGADLIKVGWTVNPTLYNDNRTRLFQYLDAGKSRCFNTLCPGWVGVRSDIPIDKVLDEISEYGKSSIAIQLFVYQDAVNGNWWLQISEKGIPIGFWPKQIFRSDGLAKSASYIAVGGEVYSPAGESLPEMGNGHLPTFSVYRSSHINNFLVVDVNGKQIDPPTTVTYSVGQYNVSDEGKVEGFGRLFFYGGIASNI